MTRKATFLIGSGDGLREIYIDDANGNSIIQYINRDERHRKKFQFIAEIILRGLRNSEVYDFEKINHRASNITAMKFFKGQENDRIYCKEYEVKGKIKIVVAILLYEKKKTQKMDKRIKSIFEKISTYEYEF